MEFLCEKTACCSICDKFCLLPIWTGAPPSLKDPHTDTSKSIQVLSIFLPSSQPRVCTGLSNPEDAIAEVLEELDYTGESVDVYSIDALTIIRLDQTCLSNYSSDCWRSFIFFYTRNHTQDKWSLILEDPLNELVLQKTIWSDITIRQIISTVFEVSDQ